MIREALSEEESTDNGQQTTAECACGCTGFKTMLMMAIATSIDALAVGVSFAFLSVDLWKSVAVIGITTFLFSFAGVRIGNIFGSRYSKAAEITGGVILILLGCKILVEHLFFS
jgi:putative Mn2+ efflux pump MntP